jgi:signal peptidase II
VKARTIALIILLILIVDQAVKIWVKTHMGLNDGFTVFGKEPGWFQIDFVENPGMAYGWKFGGEWGKIALTLFRLFAVIGGIFIIRGFIRKKVHKGLIVCSALIFAGALGNLIDSMFYGIIFDKGMIYDLARDHYTPYYGLATFSHKGYSSFLHGNVVDMLYFPLVKTHYPSWIPFVGGQEFEFFSPVFNIADASISIGVGAILLFQKRFFKKDQENGHPAIETNSPVNDHVQVL